MNSDHSASISGIIERVSNYVTEPPRGSDPVIRLASPAELTEVFATSVGLPFDDTANAHDNPHLLAAVEQVIKYSMQTSHPRFVNQNFAGPDPLSVVGDWLGAALNTTGATYEVAPVFTLMESAVLGKLGRIAGYVDGLTASNPGNSKSDSASDGGLPTLPPGLFCAGGSMGTLFALQLARHRHQPDITTHGSNGDRLALFVSDSGHYAASKSAALLGIGTEGVVKVATDHEGAMVPQALREAIQASISAGQTPFAVIATAGTTVTSAFDDLEALTGICEAAGLWLHVDGCYGGSALFSDDHAWRLRGIERSDSFVWNLHKMMGMTQQCTALLVRDPNQLAACFAARADYLFQSDKLNGEFDSGDRTFQCARRIDVLKLWLTWKARGDDGFAERINHAFAMAEHTRQLITSSDGKFVPLVSGSFTNVVFAWVPPHLRPLPITESGEIDLASLSPAVQAELHDCPPRIKERMQVEGTGMIGYQPIHGLNTFRMICMSTTLQTVDVEALLTTIDEAGRELKY